MNLASFSITYKLQRLRSQTHTAHCTIKCTCLLIHLLHEKCSRTLCFCFHFRVSMNDSGLFIHCALFVWYAFCLCVHYFRFFLAKFLQNARILLSNKVSLHSTELWYITMKSFYNMLFFCILVRSKLGRNTIIKHG